MKKSPALSPVASGPGAVLAELMRAKGYIRPNGELNMKRAADGAGVSQPTIRRILSGEFAPRGGTLKKLAAHFEVTEDTFLKGSLDSAILKGLPADLNSGQLPEFVLNFIVMYYIRDNSGFMSALLHRNMDAITDGISKARDRFKKDIQLLLSDPGRADEVFGRWQSQANRLALDRAEFGAAPAAPDRGKARRKTPSRSKT